MSTVALLTAVLLFGAGAPGQRAAPDPFGQTASAAAAAADGRLAVLEVPGGTAALADAAGLDSSLPRARVMLAIIRAIYEWPDGTDRAADARRDAVRAYLASLPDRPGSAPSADADLVPLPLSHAVWQALAGSTRRLPLVGHILARRDLALLYYGLSALDAPTRRWLGSQPGLLQALVSGRRPAIVAAFGRSVRVADGRVQVPGGLEAEPLWAALAGRRPSDSGEFILRLLDVDAGRLALFYDSIAHLPPGPQSFALGAREPDPAERRQRFLALYQGAGRSLAGFDPGARPFDRVADDFAHLMLMTRTSDAGVLAPPASPELWRAALTRPGIPRDPQAELEAQSSERSLDAALLLSFVSTPDAAVRRERTETWLFGQRAFRSASEAEYPDVLVALRGARRYPALVRTLERMDIVRPGTYVLAIRQAQRIEGIRDAALARVLLAQFQAALGIIERARFSRTIDAGRAENLVRTLCAALDERPQPDTGGMAGWVEQSLLSALDPLPVQHSSLMPDRPFELRVLAATSGAGVGPGRRSAFEWEGLSYDVDPGAGEFRRVTAIRVRQRGASLDAALALARAGAGILTMASPADVARMRQTLADVGQMYERAGLVDDEAPPDAPWPGPVLAEASSQLGRRERLRPGDLVKIARPVLRAAEVQLASVLLSIAYAPHLGYPDSPVLLGGDPSRHHDFGLGEPRVDARPRLAWQVPVEARSRDAGWRLTGSALGLDVALARLSLRRAFSGTLPPPPAFREADRAAFAEAAVLTNPFDADEDGRMALVAAVRSGRQRLLALAREPAGLSSFATAAGLDEWRAALMPWMGAHEPERIAEIVSLAEMSVVGGAPDTAPGTLAASGWSLGAELRGVPIAWASWTSLAGRKSTCLVPALVPDLAVGIAEALEGLGVPPALGRGVLLMATQDLLDSLRVNYDDDWMTMVGRAQRVAQGPVEDYVAGQTIWGALIPLDGSVR